jgi:tRNA pseudouridine55 synthase
VIDGFLLVDKDGGWTSHDVVAKARKLFGQKKIGHAGTLDPMATGLLVLGLGRATRAIRYVQGASKTYLATAQFGVATDTLDADGAVLNRSPMEFEENDFHAVVPRFIGDIMQVPPMVSALKIDGRRLYELAREGREVERKARPVRIDRIEVLEFAPGLYPEVSFEVDCGSGTYIRTLAADLGRALGGSAHLTGLRRTRIGALRVADAYRLDPLESIDPIEGAVVSMRDVLLHELPEVSVEGGAAFGVRNGRPLPADLAPAPDSPFCVTDDEGRLLAVYSSDGVKSRPEVVFP